MVEEDVLRNGATAKGVQDAMYEIGTRGMDELITARRECKGSGGKIEPKVVKPLFLSAVRIYHSNLYDGCPRASG